MKRSNSGIYTNPYSKYRYSNTSTADYIVDPYTYKPTTLGADLKGTVQSNLMKGQLDFNSHFDVGNRWVVNNVLECRQVNNVDGPIKPLPNPPTLFKLFKLV